MHQVRHPAVADAFNPQYSASCAEFFALLASVSGLPLNQGIAVTDAMNQHGEVLPVGQGLFHIYAADRVDEGMELLTGVAYGTPAATENYAPGSMLGQAQTALLAYRRACPRSSLEKKRRRQLRQTMGRAT